MKEVIEWNEEKYIIEFTGFEIHLKEV